MKYLTKTLTVALLSGLSTVAIAQSNNGGNTNNGVNGQEVSTEASENNNASGNASGSTMNGESANPSTENEHQGPKVEKKEPAKAPEENGGGQDVMRRD